jgi:hypothetical protein
MNGLFCPTSFLFTQTDRHSGSLFVGAMVKTTAAIGLMRMLKQFAKTQSANKINLGKKRKL